MPRGLEQSQRFHDRVLRFLEPVQKEKGECLNGERAAEAGKIAQRAVQCACAVKLRFGGNNGRCVYPQFSQPATQLGLQLRRSADVKAGGCRAQPPLAFHTQRQFPPQWP